MARDHPELGLSPSEAASLQSAYTNLCYARLHLEVSLAQITKLSEYENYVEIPTYPEQGKALLDQLKKTIADELGARSADVIAAVEPLFEGDNNALGKAEQKLVITSMNENPRYYKIVREMVTNDPQTGAFIGKSTGIDEMPPAHMGAYAAEAGFFPPVHN